MQGVSARRWLVWGLPAILVYSGVFLSNRPENVSAVERKAPEPMLLLNQSLERCRSLSDYTCVLTKQERMEGELKPAEKMEVRYREEPLSIDLRWVENVGRIRRAVYIQGRHVTKDGREQVVVEPADAVARFFAGTVKIDVRGEQAREASRRTIDEFGFRQMVEQVLTETRQIERQTRVKWQLDGTGLVDGRPTYVLVRYVPIVDADDENACARLVLQIDQEWMLPVELKAYADSDGDVLLERYTITKVALNPGLSEEDFKL